MTVHFSCWSAHLIRAAVLILPAWRETLVQYNQQGEVKLEWIFFFLM